MATTLEKVLVYGEELPIAKSHIVRPRCHLKSRDIKIVVSTFLNGLLGPNLKDW